MLDLLYAVRNERGFSQPCIFGYSSCSVVVRKRLASWFEVVGCLWSAMYWFTNVCVGGPINNRHYQPAAWFVIFLYSTFLGQVVKQVSPSEKMCTGNRDSETRSRSFHHSGGSCWPVDGIAWQSLAVIMTHWNHSVHTGSVLLSAR